MKLDDFLKIKKVKCADNKTTNTLPFKVKCIYIDNDYLTVGEEYIVVEVEDGFYKVKNDSGEFWWYHNNRFEVFETPPKDKQEFSLGGVSKTSN